MDYISPGLQDEADSPSNTPANLNNQEPDRAGEVDLVAIYRQNPIVAGGAVIISPPEHSSDKSDDLASGDGGLQIAMNGLSRSLNQMEVSTTSTSESENGETNLFCLGKSWAMRFKASGELEEINQAVECHSRAVQLTSSEHSDRPEILDHLGNSLQSRFQLLGTSADINKAVSCHSQAVSLTSDGHADKPNRLNNLGISLMRQFEHLGDLADIRRAIETQSMAVSLTPDGDVMKPGRLTNLGASHLRRFEHLGDVADIDKAIVCQSQAVSFALDSDADKPAMLNNLGNSHRGRFEHLSDLADIDRAIECQSQAMSLTSEGHPMRSGRLTNLGASHLRRFEHLGELADIDRAIVCQTQAVSLTPDGRVYKPAMLNNLGISHRNRFQRLDDLADIDRAIECLSKAVMLTPDGHADKPSRFNNLGNAHQSRSQHLRDLADIEKAIEYHSQAILLTPDSRADKPSWLNSLGSSHMCRFERSKDIGDVDKAIACQSQAVVLTPDGHADLPTWLKNLGSSHQTRFKHSRNPEDLDWAIARFQMSAHCLTGKSLCKFEASRAWARLSMQHNQSAAISAYQWTMDLVPKVVWIGSTMNRRYEEAQLMDAVAVEAAAVAVSEKEYGLALEWLEAGRSIVWSQMLQLRTQFDDLYVVDPELAESLKNVALALEHASSREAGDGTGLEAAGQKHRRLTERYENLIIQARQVPGFPDFMRSKRATELIPAARSGPVVVINVHTSRCDALILRPHTDEIMHVPLPDVSDTKVAGLQHQMKHFASRTMTERKPHLTRREHKDCLDHILSALWHKIVKPVLDALGYVEKLSVDQLPHITWCTTGALSMLPIHAAGCYDQTGNNLFAYAVSSYAPTLSSLLSSDSRPLELGGILAVSQEATLPATKQELDDIKRHAEALPYLQFKNHEATAEAVLNAMEQFNSVHFACHASQSLSRPLESCFHLHDRGLSLADITKRSLKNKGLAFLSACQTATGDEKSPDEAIHLAAGMLVAGYPTVIATMWSIIDSDAPIVADHVYGQLIRDGKLDDGRVARALHVAVAALRDRVGEKEFVRWAPYIHVGV